MHLIIGGAYQGKLELAKRRYGLKNEDICDCAEAEPQFSCRCVCHIEEFTLRCARAGAEAKDWFAARRAEWADSVFICADISCGVVPMEPEEREWREMTGRLLNWLSGEAETVTRVFCGLPQELKP